MAMTPEKIQRWGLGISNFDNGVWRTIPRAELIKYGDGSVVLYSDHLRHLKLAQIAVLEELREHMRSRHANESNPTGSYCNEESLWIGDKIQKLRREIG